MTIFSWSTPFPHPGLYQTDSARKKYLQMTAHIRFSKNTKTLIKTQQTLSFWNKKGFSGTRATLSFPLIRAYSQINQEHGLSETNLQLPSPRGWFADTAIH